MHATDFVFIAYRDANALILTGGYRAHGRRDKYPCHLLQSKLAAVEGSDGSICCDRTCTFPELFA